MKKKLVLKPFVLPVVYSIIIVALIVSVYFTTKPNLKTEEDYTYVSGSILDEYVPVWFIPTLFNSSIVLSRPL